MSALATTTWPTRRLRGVAHSRAFETWAFPAALLLLVAYASARYPTFRSVDTARSILAFAAIPFLVAVGQTMVVLGRGVDLSVGSMVGLSGSIFGALVSHGHPVWLAVAAALGAGAGLGVFNGVLITKARISFLIVTLGTFAIVRSLAQVVLDGQSVSVYSSTFESLANGQTAGVPNDVILAAGVYLAALTILRGTVYGRSLYAVGANPEAARLAGIRVDRVLILAYLLCATLAAFAGVLTVGQLGAAQPSSGTGMELAAITAVLLGGTRFSGGYGGVTRTLVGVIFLGVLNNVLFVSGVSSFWQGTATGLVLVAAVAVDRSRRD